MIHRNFILICFFSVIISTASAGDLLTLEKARSLAVSSSLSLKKAVSEMDTKQLELAALKYDWYPDISLTGGYSASYSDSNDSKTPSAGVSLNQQLWDGGGYSVNREISRIENKTAEYEWENTIYSIRKECDTLFYDYIEAKAQEESARSALEAAQVLYETGRTKYETGSLSGISFLEIRSDTAARKSEVLQAARNTRSAETELLSFTGLEVLPETPRLDQISENSLIGLLKALDAEKSDTLPSSLCEERMPHYTLLKSAGNDIQASELDKKLIKTEYNPELSFSLSRSVSDTETDGLKTVTGASVTASLSLTRWSRKNRLLRADIEIAEKCLTSDELKKDYRLDVREAWYDTVLASGTIVSLETSMEYAKEYYNEVKTKYEMMSESFANLKDAEADYSDAESAYITGIFDFQRCVSQLLCLLELEDEKELAGLISRLR